MVNSNIRGGVIMKKILIALSVAVLAVFCMAGCSGGEVAEPDGTFGESIELTIYANGGVMMIGEENPYEAELSAGAIENGMSFEEAIGDKIVSIEKAGAEFAGWMVYVTESGEWVTEEVTELEEGQLSVPCGDYGYYLIKDYEVLSENATTEELLDFVCDGRSAYAYAVWK